MLECGGGVEGPGCLTLPPALTHALRPETPQSFLHIKVADVSVSEPFVFQMLFSLLFFRTAFDKIYYFYGTNCITRIQTFDNRLFACLLCHGCQLNSRLTERLFSSASGSSSFQSEAMLLGLPCKLQNT